MLAEIESGATIVTANRRLARTLRERYHAAQVVRGRAVWRTPPILPWSAWLDALWEERLYTSGGALPLRLSPEQERLVWERVIRRSPESDHLLSILETADAAREAWSLLHAWRLDLRAIEAAANEDTLAFLSWAREFEHECENERWLDGARLPDHLADALEGLSLPERVLLAGFGEFTPQQERFVEACRRAGASVDLLPAGNRERGSAVRRVAFTDRGQEIAAAAGWARACIEREGGGVVGVILPDLEDVRDQVERLFTEVFHPAAVLPSSKTRPAAFNISAGVPLAKYPAIRAALLALSFDPFRNELPVLGAFLRSPFLDGAETERTARALLDARLRESGSPEVSAETIARLCADFGALALRAAIGRWLDARSSLRRKQPASGWSRDFSVLLEKLGWPGERSLSSEEYQALQAWGELLSEFARLDAVGAEFEYSEARTRLARMASETMFQPEGANAPVQVLGVLEASGMQFDHLWIAGLDDEAWPSPARPTPFLPVVVQRARGVPHASPERELDFARLVTNALLTSAPDIVVSHALRDQDRELGPSPLIRCLEEAPIESLLPRATATLADVLRISSLVETFEDAAAPPLPEAAWQRGGVKVFQYQATCPFHAFAELRLSATALECPEPGLGARDRGIAVHAALENVWRELQTHVRLCSYRDGELQAIVRDAVARALESLATRRGQPLPARFAALEQQRLERLVAGWLEIEKGRTPFTVMRPESERTVELSGIRARVRIDRIDRLEDGREVIIDYKTNQPRVADWSGERPSQPQLPLYAATHDGALAAVAFAQVRAGDLRFKGLGTDPPGIPGARPADLEAEVNAWRGVLEQLGRDFRAGRAAVDPKDASACRTCSLAPLCRVMEADLDTSALLGEVH